MSYQPLDHHEVEVARLGRVRLPPSEVRRFVRGGRRARRGSRGARHRRLAARLGADDSRGGGAGAVGTVDSDGDGFSDGSFAESPEMGGRGDESSHGADPSAPASDGGTDDTGDDDSGAGADTEAGDPGASAGGFRLQRNPRPAGVGRGVTPALAYRGIEGAGSRRAAARGAV
jgi:hypothetical protein